MTDAVTVCCPTCGSRDVRIIYQFSESRFGAYDEFGFVMGCGGCGDEFSCIETTRYSHERGFETVSCRYGRCAE